MEAAIKLAVSRRFMCVLFKNIVGYSARILARLCEACVFFERFLCGVRAYWLAALGL